ncbi:MAG TPA: MarR family transcriptional regulator [Pseudonocardiaceae bacterium]|nr:MarR family transcriptional regulator [Pseudonocardiaceae bacterium]
MAARRSPAEPTLLYLIKQVELAIRARLDEILRPAGLTALQYTALTVLEGHSDLTASQLARRSFVTAQSTADLVNALLDRGLVERHRDPADRRRLVLALTRAGHQVLDEYRPRVANLESAMLRGLDGSETAALRANILTCWQALMGDSGDGHRN